MAANLDQKLRLPHINFRVRLHAANMRHGTNGFISLSEEGVRQLRPVLKPRTWVPRASTLPPDHRGRDEYTKSEASYLTDRSKQERTAKQQREDGYSAVGLVICTDL